MSMPSIPVSIFIEKEIKPLIEGKTITDARCEMVYEGRYSWHKDSFDNLHEIINAGITYADSHFIYTDSGKVIDFGYYHGDLRYYPNTAGIEKSRLKKPVTHGYMITFVFHDGSCMTLTLYSWSTHFRIRTYDPREGRLKQSPIDAADENDFTPVRFSDWLADKGKENIIENCSTVHGAFDIDNPVMSYILLLSGVHPRTKTGKLSDAEIKTIFDHTKKLISEYKSGERICEYNNIFGKKAEAKNDIVRMNSDMLGKSCPCCGTPIDSVPCAGTKMYFCPKCQPLKK